MTEFLPALNWAEERSLYPSFASILKFISKLFRKFQSGDPPVSCIYKTYCCNVSCHRVMKHGRCLLDGWMELQVV